MYDRWYDFVFGGRKAYQGVIAATLITFAYQNLPIDARPGLFWNFVLAILAAFSIFTLGNYQEHKLNSKNRDGPK